MFYRTKKIGRSDKIEDETLVLRLVRFSAPIGQKCFTRNIFVRTTARRTRIVMWICLHQARMYRETN